MLEYRLLCKGIRLPVGRTNLDFLDCRCSYCGYSPVQLNVCLGRKRGYGAGLLILVIALADGFSLLCNVAQGGFRGN